MSLESLKGKKERVLNKTIAHSIVRELRELRSDPATHGKRCVIELVQNAMDATDETVDVRIERQGDNVAFEHNGRPFGEEELINLVYHGSTKGDLEESSGKLGTGFLATHLISMKTIVTSSLEGKTAFTFTLDREAKDDEELTEKMQATWKELENSLKAGIPPPTPKTHYHYTMSNDEQRHTYEFGINLLKDTAPIILAFDERLRSITIVNDGQTLEWRLTSPKGSEIVDVQVTIDGKVVEEGMSRFVIARSATTSIAVPMEKQNGKFSFANVSLLPKLYYPLPFVSCQAFPFPALISDRGFVSPSNREAPSLTSSQESAVLENKRKIERAYAVLPQLLKKTKDLEYPQIHNLARLPNLLDSENFFVRQKTDQEWLHALVSTLIAHLRALDLVLTSTGLRMPKASKIPLVMEHADQLSSLWKLIAGLYPDAVPTIELAKPWSEIVKDWIGHLGYPGRKSVELDEVLTVEKLADAVEASATLTDLQSRIIGRGAIDWMNDFLGLIVSLGKNLLLTTKNMLPSQSGTLRSSKDLYKDKGISETLKDIASKLDYHVRSSLLHNGLNLDIVDKSLSEDHVLPEVLSRMKNGAKDDYASDAYQKTNVLLFGWLVERARYDEIRDSFPIFTKEKEDGESKYIQFFSREAIFLSPSETWDQTDRIFADVFPSRAILSNLYSNLPESCWKGLAETNLVLRALLTQRAEILRAKEMRFLSVDEIPDASADDKDKVIHMSKAPVILSTLPFMREKDWGVFDRMGGSRPRATRFLNFMMENLIKKDPGWKNPVDIPCECGSVHRVRPCLWLETIATRQWIPISGGEPERPGSENLAGFFTQQNLLQTLSDPDASFFLAVLGVSVSAIMTANKSKSDRIEYEKAVSRLIVATGMDASQLSSLADAYSDNNVRRQLQDIITRKQVVRDNQKIGRLVERLIREELCKELLGTHFSVSRVIVGSDIRVSASRNGDSEVPLDPVDNESDILDDNGNEVLFQVSTETNSHYIEVKSARGKEVKMTVPQAHNAHFAEDNFSLCVVPVDFSIISLNDEEAAKIVQRNARFVYPIGDKLGGALTDIASILKGEKQRLSKTPEDIEAAVLGNQQLRVRVREPVWTNGIEFSMFVRLFVPRPMSPRVSQMASDAKAAVREA